MKVDVVEAGSGRVQVVGRWGSKRFPQQPATDVRGFAGWTEACTFDEVEGRSRGQCVISGNVVAAGAGEDHVVVQVRLVIYIGSGPIILASDVIGLASPIVRVPIDLTEWIDRVTVEARQIVDGAPSGSATAATVAEIAAQLVMED